METERTAFEGLNDIQRQRGKDDLIAAAAAENPAFALLKRHDHWSAIACYAARFALTDHEGSGSPPLAEDEQDVSDAEAITVGLALMEAALAWLREHGWTDDEDCWPTTLRLLWSGWRQRSVYTTFDLLDRKAG